VLHCPQIAAADDDLSNDNLSTARDMSRALLALSADPTLPMTASAPSWTLAAKTGYTDTAGYCFTGLVEGEDGRRLLVTVLGAPSSGSRWADVERLLSWARG